MGMFILNSVAYIFFGLFTSSYCFGQQGLKTPENYGPYAMHWHSAELCKGPKAVNATLESINFNKNSGLYILNLTFLVEARIDEVKVIVSSEDNGAKTTLWNYRIKNPCRHFMIAHLIQPILKTDSCVVKKGSYMCQINFEESSKLFLGSSFFYGKFIFKNIVTSKSGNIHCFQTIVSFSKLS